MGSQLKPALVKLKSEYFMFKGNDGKDEINRCKLCPQELRFCTTNLPLRKLPDTKVSVENSEFIYRNRCDNSGDSP